MGVKEEVYYEGGPHIGDLIINILLGFTVICLPLTFGALARALWLRYRITDRRVSVIGGWMGRDQSDIIYSDISKIVTVPRGLGAWGDMVITLKDGSRLELRAMPKFREVYDFMNQRLSARAQQASGAVGK
jgi:hypothetical protein